MEEVNLTNAMLQTRVTAIDRAITILIQQNKQSLDGVLTEGVLAEAEKIYQFLMKDFMEDVKKGDDK